MAWIFEQSTGRLFYPDGKTIIALAYAGAPGYINNPGMQELADKGPIPQGDWEIGRPYDDAETGKFTLPLSPLGNTETFGRSAFKIHGDNIQKAGLFEASHGCIIAPRFAREAISASPDNVLSVVATVAPTVQT